MASESNQPMPEKATNYLEGLGIPKDLVLEFLMRFARLEYALKRSGHYKADQTGGSLTPDWDWVQNTLVKAKAETTRSILDSCLYLRNNPPRKQCVHNGSLGWTDSPTQGTIQDILLSLRTVRNNLMHGGKFPFQPADEPSRDEQLLRASIALLLALGGADELSDIAPFLPLDA
jgi:hypothetical protein